MKKLLVFLIVCICIVCMYLYPHAMLNPGELVEGHQKLNNKCLSCHEPFWGLSNDKCIACHKLSEIGKDTSIITDTSINKKKILFHAGLAKENCTVCHTDHKGVRPAMSLTGFSHELLPGAIITNCNSCHEIPADIIHRQLSAECRNCHNTNGWKAGVVFNHDIITGADKNNCSGCHQKPNDKYHLLLKGNCDKCHSTGKWVPSTFDHSNFFQLDKKHNASCVTCHVNADFSAYTCYGCHEHSEGNMQKEHNEEGIYNLDKCASCHRSGNEHDIKMNDGTINKSSKEGEKKGKEKNIREDNKGEGRDDD